MCVFFFKQKTAYEMRISDWSSDVCSSDLGEGVEIGNPLDLSVQPIGPVMVHAAEVLRVAQPFRPQPVSAAKADVGEGPDRAVKIGRASCRERVGQYV